MLELIIIVILALLGGDTGDYPSSGSRSSRSKTKRRTSYSSHDIGCDGYCYDCDDYHDDY